MVYSFQYFTVVTVLIGGNDKITFFLYRSVIQCFLKSTMDLFIRTTDTFKYLFPVIYDSYMIVQGMQMIGQRLSDMSAAFISSVKNHFKNADLTVDWFHVVQLFTRAVDEVRRAEAKKIAMPKTTRWAVLKNAEGDLTNRQFDALVELAAMDLHTSIAWRVKEALRWIRRATSLQGAKWRMSSFLNYARELIGEEPMLAPVRKAVNTVEKHRQAIVARWHSDHSNARLEGLNSIFQASKARARGYRNDLSFITIIYLVAAPIQDLLNST